MLTLLALALAAMSAALLLAHGAGEEGARAVIRATARSSLGLFAVTFTASSLRRLWRTPATGWLLRNRRQLGLSFAVSHALHGAAIALLVASAPPGGAGIPLSTRVGGTIGYAALAVLAATSNDRAVARLGAGRWRRLHRAGSWVLWLVFAATYLPAAHAAPARHAAYGAVVLAIAALRAAALARSYRTARSSPSASSRTGQ